MEIIRYRLKPLSSFITDWASDTIFGCLAWALVNREGEAALHTLLEACADGAPPFVLSDAFPGDLLPRPLIPTPPRQKEGFGVEDIAAAKRQKKMAWVPLAVFEAARRGEPYEVPVLPQPFVSQAVLHNQINRLSQTTAQGGELYSVEETWLNTNHYPYLSLYALVEPGWRTRLQELLEEVGQFGIGRRASTGKGAFTVLGSEPFSGFSPLEKANGFITLGSYVPRAAEGAPGFYKVKIKRGRLGQERSHWPTVFKNPVVFLVAGSAFYGRPEHPFAGRLVHNVAPGVPDVVQCGLTLVLPACLPPLD
ncbi:MAG: CRISPR-associated protein Csm4 [Bacillota bacterium]|jgi:CRISPR-associated protein Csm4|nr:CRISPR-associated protein Csm4 [Bacillota bacterium]